eukprot:3938700-Rhodomonas_salina.4
MLLALAKNSQRSRMINLQQQFANLCRTVSICFTGWALSHARHLPDPPQGHEAGAATATRSQHNP